MLRSVTEPKRMTYNLLPFATVSFIDFTTVYSLRLRCCNLRDKIICLMSRLIKKLKFEIASQIYKMMRPHNHLKNIRRRHQARHKRLTQHTGYHGPSKINNSEMFKLLSRKLFSLSALLYGTDTQLILQQFNLNCVFNLAG